VYLKDEDKELIIDSIKDSIPELQALYLFGSQNDGSATNSSDIDIAYLTPKPLDNVERWELSQRLASLVSQDVDLIELSQTNTIFRYQILSTAERIYGEGYEVESFETLAYSFYLRFEEERKPIVDAICEDRKYFPTGEVMRKWKLNNRGLSHVRCS